MPVFLTTYRNYTGVNMSSLSYLLQIIWIPQHPYLISCEGGEGDQVFSRLRWQVGPWHKMCSQSGNNSDYVKQHAFLPLLQSQQIIKLAGIWIALNLRFSPMFFLRSPEQS